MEAAETERLDEIRAVIQGVAYGNRETYSPTRYPWTYAADFLRANPQILPAHIADGFTQRDSRAAASHARRTWADELGLEDHELAGALADGYLTEHGIPLAAAVDERLALDKSARCGGCTS